MSTRWTEADLAQVRQRLYSPPTQPPQQPKGRQRFLNQRIEFDGHKFDSKSELNRYMTLKEMEKHGLIEGLRVHPVYALTAINDAYIGDYEADFSYFHEGGLVVEDCKSPRTAELRLFQWKQRHFEAQYGLSVRMIVRRWKKREARTA